MKNIEVENRAYFFLEERMNRFAKNGKEWVMYVKIGDAQRWSATEWDERPSGEEYVKAKRMAMRCFEIYHRHLSIPSFNMKHGFQE